VTFFVKGGKSMNEIADCPVCGYPIITTNTGESLVCANCHANLIAEGITIPTGLFWGLVAFGAGILLGPALLGSTESGRSWLAEHSKFK